MSMNTKYAMYLPSFLRAPARFEFSAPYLLPAAFFALLSFLIVLGACRSTTEAEPRTGLIKKEKRADGNIELIVVGKASPNALRKNKAAMKMATSREAAELLINNELRNLGAKSTAMARLRFKKLEMNFLRGGAYCRIRGVYYPGKMSGP